MSFVEDDSNIKIKANLSSDNILLELTALREELTKLKKDKHELQLLIELNTQHSDSMAEELFNQVEATLRESVKQFRSIVETMPIPVLISRMSDGRIVYVNNLVGPLLGFSNEALLHRKTLDFYGNLSDRDLLLDMITQQGNVSNYEIQVKKADKTCIWVSVFTRPLTFNNEPCLLTALHDLTERKRFEAEQTRLVAIRRELSLAQNIQKKLLPPSSPNWDSLDIVCYTTPASKVGGDFYIYHAFNTLTKNTKIAFEKNGLKTNTAQFCIAVGDVSGKGMPAALLMAVSLASIQVAIEQALKPSDLLIYLDQVLNYYTKDTDQNCALCYVEITMPDNHGKGGLLRAANAGCIQPILRRKNGKIEWINVLGIPLGIKVGQQLGYNEKSIPLNPGDIIVLTSDGVCEAMSADKKMFSLDRLEHTVANGPTSSAKAMLAHIQTEIVTFVGTSEIHDDLTIVVLKI